jgi:methyl-accepting chemotaxis protein
VRQGRRVFARAGRVRYARSVQESPAPAPAPADAYRAFLATRWAPRARLLIRYGLGATAMLLLFDWGLTRQQPEPPSFGRILLLRLPSALIPALGWFAQRYGARSPLLPPVTVGAAALWAWCNAAAWLALGMGDSAYHAIGILVAFVCLAAFLPVERRGRLGAYALVWLGQAALDLAWPDARPMAARLWTQGLFLGFMASTAILFEDFAVSRRRSFVLTRQLEGTVTELEASRRRMAETAVAVAETAGRLGLSASGLVERVASSGREGEAVAEATRRLAEAARALRGRSSESAGAAADATARASAIDGLIRRIEAGVREVEAAVGRSEASFEGLERRAQSIGVLVETTRDVALQTHMLAVNAGIQAVSAGEHGKGFSVIAEAIRELSRDSGRSAQEIARVVEDVGREMTGVLGAVGQVRARAGQLASAFDEARATLELVRSTVGRLGDAMGENARDAEAQATSTAGVSEATERIAALLRQQGEAAAEVARSSASLADHASGLRALLPDQGATMRPGPRDP